MADNEIFCTVKLDEDDWKAIERAIMTIEKRIERIEAILDARGLDWDHPRVEDDHFAGANKMVAEEPAKEPEPEHPPGPMPDPGEGYRILSKNPPEELAEGDDFWFSSYLEWHKSFYATLGITSQCDGLWFRRKIEQLKPAWEPKVEDWVLVTRPENWRECKDPEWVAALHQHNGMVMQISRFEQRYGAWVANFDGIDWFFHRDWLSPAEPPASEKPPEPEYREPVVPADVGKICKFSNDGNAWTEAKLRGYGGHLWQSVCSEVVGAKHWVHARIKKDA